MLLNQISTNFTNQVVLVTGGAKGIGLQVVKDFLHSGARVVIWDMDVNALQACQEELSSYAKNLTVQTVDISDFESCLSASKSMPWNLDILINNAGVTRDKTFAKMNMDDFAFVIDTNLKGFAHVTKALQNHFLGQSKETSVVNISSIVGLHGNFGQTNYAAAKAGVIGFTKSLAKEWGSKGVRVNAIAPGFIKTEMVDKIPEDVQRKMCQSSPLKRMGTVQDISHACLFLASDAARFIHGAVISVDGGMNL